MEAGGYVVVVSLLSNNVVIKREETPRSRAKSEGPDTPPNGRNFNDEFLLPHVPLKHLLFCSLAVS